VRTLKGHTGWVSSMAFSPSSRRLASGGSGDGTVKLWDVRTGLAARSFTHGDFVTCVALSHSGRLLAAGGDDGVVKLWDTVTGRQQRVLENSNLPDVIREVTANPEAGAGVHSVAFSNDDTTLATGC